MIEKEVEKMYPNLKELYKGKKFVLDGEEIDIWAKSIFSVFYFILVKLTYKRKSAEKNTLSLLFYVMQLIDISIILIDFLHWSGHNGQFINAF